MKKTWFCVLIATVVGGTVPMVLGVNNPNPYQGIVDRNPFALKTPPPPQEPPPVTPLSPPAKIIVTGIVSMFGPIPRALLEITEQEKGKSASTRKPILRQGERDGSIEVLSIDVEKSIVRIRNGNEEKDLSFEAPKLMASAPTPPIPTNFAPPLNHAAPPAHASATSTSQAGRGSGVTIVGAGSPAVTSATPVPGASAPVVSPDSATGTMRPFPARAARVDSSAPVDNSATFDPGRQYPQMPATGQDPATSGIPQSTLPAIPNRSVRAGSPRY